MYCSIDLKLGAAVVKLLLPILNDIEATVNNLEETVNNLASQQDDIDAKLDSLSTKQDSLDIKQDELNMKVMSVNSTVSNLASQQDDIDVKLDSLSTKQDSLNKKQDELNMKVMSVNLTVSNLASQQDDIEVKLDSLSTKQDSLETNLKLDSLHAKQNELNMEVLSVSFKLENNVSSEVKKTYDLLDEHVGYACGGERGWRRVVYLNVTDPTTTTCPSGWHLITDSPKRTCGRFNDGSVNCASVFFPVTGLNYSIVCGTLRAYQHRWMGGFHNTSIDETYVTGVSLTHGTPRQHIWTFAAGFNEYEINRKDICPCDAANSNDITVPSFVGGDYFCESGFNNHTSGSVTGYHKDDPLWDGKECSSSSRCCEFNNPPYFIKKLSGSTSDDIEARLCRASALTDTPIEFIELYVK